MRVLFVTTYFPGELLTPVRGLFGRMSLFLEAIARTGELDVLWYAPPELRASMPRVPELEEYLKRRWNCDVRLALCNKALDKRRSTELHRFGAGMFSFFRQSVHRTTSGPPQVEAFETCVRRWKPDAILAHRLRAMCPALLTAESLPPIFLDLDEVEHSVLLRGPNETSGAVKMVKRLHLPALLWGELQAIRLAYRTFVCSDLDREYLGRDWGLPGVATIPNAVSVPAAAPLTREPTLLFLGSYTYRPNVEAAEFLLKSIWPRVRRARPDARLIVAGHPAERIRGYGSDLSGVEFTGFVPDLDALYRRSRVVCAPVLCGAGTRVKLVEAAAHGKAMVSTTIGAEGLELRDGQEIVMRDDPESFAEACVTLLTDDSLCERLGSAARTVAVERYDRAKVVGLIRGYLADAGRERAEVSRVAAGARVGA